ncbi:RNA polymerase sigma-70 factor, ECF subfamily [Fictibacillus solisalsi]|uniref:RNA polymerase sigma-70 factor, ECF subfamily n=1 Tax=Fictibacillus solisalsi TaxID=459525 RepID=A0A1G9TS50_9BACL|nr:RNA polymerase sigma-70 factor [Fictibacillus solisalsi]SDM50546.1 RNA polymerase sigma-70 factor, ECF subfamily [Fictibacillus solisalsi]
MEPLQSEQLFTDHRPLLFSLAYRMLGSVQDAEDIIQDVFIALNDKDTGHIQNQKAYLCKMVTNRCIDQLKSARNQREHYVGTWLPEPLLTDNTSQNPSDYVSMRESVSTAYLLLLQQLSETERAVFLLKEVLDYSYKDIADIVGKSSSNCRQIFHRAKKSIGPPPQEHKITQKGKLLTEQFFEALMKGDTSKLLNLLTADASLLTDGGGKVKAAIFPILGADRIARFYLGIRSKLPANLTFSFTSVNGMPGVVLSSEKHVYSVLSFDVRDNKIQNIYSVLNPEKLSHIGV